MEDSVAKRLVNARKSFEKQQRVLLSTFQSLQVFKLKFIACVKEKDSLIQKLQEVGLGENTSKSQHEQELEQLRQEITRAHEQSRDKITTLSQRLEANQSKIEDLQKQLISKSQEAHKLQENENKHTQEIETVRVECDAQKSALESQIASLKAQTEQPNSAAANAHQEARIKELQATVQALESDKIGSQTKVSELTDAASSLRQQLQDAQKESEALMQQIKIQSEDVQKLEAQVKEQKNKYTEEIKSMRVEYDAQKSALESQIASLKKETEQHQAEAKENQTGAPTAHQEELDACTARVKELQATVQALESGKIGSRATELTDAACALRQQLQDAQKESEALMQQIRNQSEDVQKLEAQVKENKNKHTEAIKAIRVGHDAQKSALESQIASLKEQVERIQTEAEAKENQTSATANAHQEELDACKTREKELQATVQALEGSPAKVSELTDVASSLKQQLRDSRHDSESLTQKAQKQAKSIKKLEAKVAKLTSANDKLLSQYEMLSKQQEDSAEQSQKTQTKLKQAEESHANAVQRLAEYKTKIDSYDELKSRFDDLSKKQQDSVTEVQVKVGALEEEKALRAQAEKELENVQAKLGELQKLKSRLKKLSQQHKDSVDLAKKTSKELEQTKELHAKALKELKGSKSKSGMSNTRKILFLVIPLVIVVAGVYYNQLSRT